MNQLKTKEEEIALHIRLAKDELAKSFAYSWSIESQYNSRTDDLEDAYLAGWNECEKHIKAQASEGFREWELRYFGTHENCPQYMSHIETCWQARQPEIDALKAEIEGLKNLFNGEHDLRKIEFEAFQKLQAENKQLKTKSDLLDYFMDAKNEMSEKELIREYVKLTKVSE